MTKNKGREVVETWGEDLLIASGIRFGTGTFDVSGKLFVWVELVSKDGTPFARGQMELQEAKSSARSFEEEIAYIENLPEKSTPLQ